MFRPLTLQRRHTLVLTVTWHDPNKEHDIMAIEVRIPTILRSYTGGAKVVEGAGDTLADLLTDLDSLYAGLKGRLVTDAGAFVSRKPCCWPQSPTSGRRSIACTRMSARRAS